MATAPKVTVPMNFEVKWMVDRCTEYFTKITNSILQPCYTDLLFLLEEAAFFFSTRKSRQLLDIVLNNIKSLNWEEQFIARYCNTVTSSSW